MPHLHLPYHTALRRSILSSPSCSSVCPLCYMLPPLGAQSWSHPPFPFHPTYHPPDPLDSQRLLTLLSSEYAPHTFTCSDHDYNHTHPPRSARPTSLKAKRELRADDLSVDGSYYNPKCSNPGCPRMSQYPEGCPFTACCKACFNYHCDDVWGSCYWVPHDPECDERWRRWLWENGSACKVPRQL